jgi:uncharacterized membrane protein YesL
VFHNNEKPRERAFDIALQRWFHAITDHFFFAVLLGALSLISLMLTMGCIWFFTETGGVIFLAAAVPLAAIAGGIWASIHGINRQLQFDHVSYLFQAFWKHLRQNFLQGACLGILLALVCGLLYLPVVVFPMLQEAIPFALICVILFGTLLLPVLTDYTFYQISHWEIGLFAAIQNSFFLMFQMGWRSIAVCVIWLAYYFLMIMYPLILAPLSLFCGIMSVLNMTTQALFAPKMEALMTRTQSSN